MAQDEKALEEIESRPFFEERKIDDLSGHAHRQLIGYLGLALPAVLWIIAGLRPMEGLERWKVLGSISAYYYTGATAAFVGILVTLGLYLFTYRGYRNKAYPWERVAALLAGAAALAVAFFPAEAREPLVEPSWWSRSTGWIHYGAAVILFGMFCYFSLFLFTRSDPTPGRTPLAEKKRRNSFYRACGFAILAGLVWAGVASYLGKPIFLPESVMLAAFAFSWLAKGRAFHTAKVAARKSWHYTRHPGRLAERARLLLGIPGK